MLFHQPGLLPSLAVHFNSNYVGKIIVFIAMEDDPLDLVRAAICR